jgi:tRNA-specific 2-thiouridylase
MDVRALARELLPPPSDGRRTVAIAMSGGVDSSVAAALCVAAGFETFGIMLRLWSEPGATGANRCCTPDAVADAQAVADVLGIPFYVQDVAQDFKRAVVDDFLAAAARGDTPNPCFACNRRVRFGLLLERARAVGADLLATGHYARVDQVADGRWRLRRGLDPAKDQSYVLHQLDQARLSRALFPVGGMAKPDVRRLAEAVGLPVADRADSVDLCWVGEGGLGGFLERHLSEEHRRPGPILDEEGREVGRHEGLPRYTLGQRKGLGVALGKPVYVVARDAARNALVVGTNEALWAREVRVGAMHWQSGAPPVVVGAAVESPGPGLPVLGQVRYGAAATSARLWPTADGGARVLFDEPVRAPTPGQGLVLWLGDEVLGGGPITAPESRS